MAKLGRPQAREIKAADHPLYWLWSNIKKRCYDTKSKGYPDYGARGIKMSPLWRTNFWAFVEGIGPRPSSSHTVDRKDVNGNYCLSNCRWATPAQQANNRRSGAQSVLYKGIEQPLTDLAEAHGLLYTTLKARLARGIPLEEALTTHSRRRKIGTREHRTVTFKNQTLTPRAWALKTNVPHAIIILRLREGWKIKKALTTPHDGPVTLTHKGQTRTIQEWVRLTGIPFSTIMCRIKSGRSPAEILRSGRAKPETRKHGF